MKFNYLFVDDHNGHYVSHHPFSSDTLLTQKRITDLLIEIPGAGRCGTHIGHLFDKLIENNIDFKEFNCPCCNKIIDIVEDFEKDRWKRNYNIEWILLNCVSGNY
jgi:hypothetical protein